MSRTKNDMDGNDRSALGPHMQQLLTIFWSQGCEDVVEDKTDGCAHRSHQIGMMSPLLYLKTLGLSPARSNRNCEDVNEDEADSNTRTRHHMGTTFLGPI